MDAATMPPEVRTERLVLRPYEERDAAALVARIGDPAVCRMLARVPYPYRREDAEAFLDGLKHSSGRNVIRAIAHGDALIGGMGLDDVEGRREFGYWLGRSYWGKGYATEAGRAFLAGIFRHFGAAPIRSGAFIDNPASLHVQEKLGFVVVGRHPVRCLARGEDVDHVDTLLDPERFLSRAGEPRPGR